MNFTKTILLTVLSGLFLSIQLASAQRASSDRVKYNYYRPPLQKLDESIKTYSVSVNIPYAEDYNRKMAEYEAEDQKAEEEYQQEMAEYKNRDTDEVILDKYVTGKKEPTKRYVDRPDVRYDIISENVVSSEISIQGFNETPSGGLKVEVTVSDYEIAKAPKTTKKGEETYTYYELRISQRMHVKVTAPDGKILYNAYPPNTASQHKYKTSPQKNWYSYERTDSYKSWLAGKEAEVTQKSAQAVSEALNSEFGYSWPVRYSSIYTGKKRKYDYSAQERAAITARHGLEELSIDEEGGKEKLREVVEVWKKEVQQMDSGDRKARINHKVGAALLLNLAVAYINLQEFDNAEEVLTRVEMNDDFKNGDANDAEDIREFLNNQKRRF